MRAAEARPRKPLPGDPGGQVGKRVLIDRPSRKQKQANRGKRRVRSLGERRSTEEGSGQPLPTSSWPAPPGWAGLGWPRQALPGLPQRPSPALLAACPPMPGRPPPRCPRTGRVRGGRGRGVLVPRQRVDAGRKARGFVAAGLDPSERRPTGTTARYNAQSWSLRQRRPTTAAHVGLRVAAGVLTSPQSFQFGSFTTGRLMRR
jgi:hypothetical protein